MRRAEARFSASIINNSSIRCMSTGRQVGCITNTSAPRTFSWICTYTSPSLKRETRAWPRVRPRKLQTSSQSASLAVPQKTLNLSSTRARCGLRSAFSSVIGFFSAVVFSAVVVATVDIVQVSGVSVSVASYQLPVASSLLSLATGNWRLATAFLAGPLGFEPRQSAPKALDLPLVDGPVNQSLIVDFRLLMERQRGTSIVHQQSKINNQKLFADHHHGPRGTDYVGTAASAVQQSRRRAPVAQTPPASPSPQQSASSKPAGAASRSPAPPSPVSAAWPRPARPPRERQTTRTASSQSPTTTHTSRPRAKAHSFHYSARDIQERRLLRSRS